MWEKNQCKKQHSLLPYIMDYGKLPRFLKITQATGVQKYNYSTKNTVLAFGSFYNPSCQLSCTSGIGLRLVILVVQGIKG